MRRALAAVIAAALLAPACGGWRDGDVAFPVGASVNGVVDLTTGKVLDSTDDEQGHASATVVPFRQGTRLRLPVIVQPDADVEIVGIAVALPSESVLRATGAAISVTRYVLDGAEPFHPVTVKKGGDAMFGVDVEMCCPPPRVGWVEMPLGVRITYRHAGRTRVAYRPFSDIERLVVTR